MNKAEQKPHIAYVMGFMGLSGGNRIIYEHANRLADKGFKVTLLHLNDGRDRGWFKINPKVGILPFNKVEKWIDNIDIIIATFNETFWNIIDLPSNIKKAYFVQSDERRFYEKGSLGEYLSNATYTFKNVYYYTTANWMHDWLEKEFEVEAPVFHNKIDKQDFYPDPDPKLKSDNVVVLVEGNIDTPLKGVADAVKALEKTDCEKWLLTNSAPNSSKLTEIFDKMFFRPPQDQIRKIYSSADILLKTSHFESVSLPNMEAMCCGCAVISTDTKGVREYSTHLKNSYIVEVGNIEQTKEALSKLLSDKKLRNTLKKNGLEYASKNFYGWDSQIEKLTIYFINLYKKPDQKAFTIKNNYTRQTLESSYYLSEQKIYGRLRTLEGRFDSMYLKLKKLLLPYRTIRELFKKEK